MRAILKIPGLQRSDHSDSRQHARQLIAENRASAANREYLTFSERFSKIEHMSYKWIQASEIAEYAYCRRTWWLRHTRGWEPGNQRQLQAGSRYHNQHGNRVQRVSCMRGLAYILLFCVVAYVVFQLVIGA